MSNQKYSLEVAPVIPCEKGRGRLQDMIGMARGKKKIFKPRIFTKLHEWVELNFNHGFPRWATMAEKDVFALRMGPEK